MVKKLLIFFTLVGMICFPQPILAEPAKYYTEAELTAYENLKGFYETFNIIDGGKKAATTMTKEELMKYAVAYFYGGMQTDYITAAKSAGFLDANATEESLAATADGANLAKVIVNGLGYSVTANSLGGYPLGYTAAALQIGAATGVSLNDGTPITYYTLLKVFDNSLEIAMLEPKIGSDKGTYEVSDSKTVLKDVFKAEKYKGIVTSVPGAKLPGEKDVKGNAAAIDSNLYDTDMDLKDLLGHTVDYWVSTEDPDKLLYVGNSYKYNTTEVYEDDIIEKYDNRTYYIYKDGEKTSTEKITLADNANIIYNGRPATKITSASMKPNVGRIVLLDNTGDGDINTVFVYSFDVKRIVTIKSTDNTLYFKDGDSICTSDLDTLSITKNGSDAEIGFEKLEKEMVVLLGRADDGKGAVIESVTKKVSGKVNAMSEDYITIEDTEYGISEHYMREKDVSTGDKASFYIDSNNRVIAVTDISTKMTYGYFIKCEYLSSMDADLEVKLFDETGTMQILKLANKINLNGYGSKSPADFIETVKSGSDKVQPQLIQFQLNGDGKISKVDTAYNFSKAENYKNIEPTGNDDEESFRIVYSKDDGSLGYYEMLFSLGGKLDTSRGQLTFQVPSNPATAEDKDYYVTSASALATRESYNVDAYVTGSNAFSPDVYVVYDKGATKTTSYMGVIKSITPEIGEDGETAYRVIAYGPPGADCNVLNYKVDLNNVEGYYNGSKKFKADVGDFLMLNRTDRELTSAQMVFDLETKTFSRNSYGYGSYMRTDYGAVYRNLDGVITVAPIDKLAKIEELQALMANTTSAAELADYKKQIRNIEREFVVYKSNSFRRVQVKVSDSGKVTVTDGAQNLYIAYKDNQTDYSKVMVYTSEGYVWTIVEYIF